MLGALRGFVGSWAAKILLILLVGSFALWGVSGSILGGDHSNIVAEVGETQITPTVFLGAYNRNLNALQQRFGRRLTRSEAQAFGVESSTLGSVVSFATLDEFARLNALSLSEETLTRMIRENPAFQDSAGTFSRQNFQRALYNARMREADFIELQNASAIRQQITEAIAAGPLVPDYFSSAMTSHVNEERKFSWIKLTPKLVGTPKKPTEGVLKTYFEANKAQYAAPEYRKVSLLSVEPEDVADESVISDEEIKADYDARITAFTKEEKRRVQQIVFKSADKAQAAVKSLADGATFETMLEENDTKLSDADLGMLTKSSLPAAIRDQAFALDLNATSEIIEGPFGPTLIRVTEVEPGSVTPLEDVKDDIRKELALRKAADDVINLQETVEDERAGGLTLEEVGKKLKLKVRSIEAIDARGRTPELAQISDLPQSSQLLREIFRTDVGAQASPIDINQTGYLWYDVLSITSAREQTFDEVKVRVEADWLAEEQTKLLTQKAEELKARLEKGETLQTIALEVGTLDETTAFIKRTQETASFPRYAVSAGFQTGPKGTNFAKIPEKDEVLLVVVDEVRGADSPANTVGEEQIDLANQGAADDLLNQVINSLRDTYTITQNPRVIDNVLTNNPN